MEKEISNIQLEKTDFFSNLSNDNTKKKLFPKITLDLQNLIKKKDEKKKPLFCISNKILIKNPQTERSHRKKITEMLNKKYS